MADDLRLESPARPPHLLELYTSEGCSSCPPAEAWVDAWKTKPQLWQEVVPIVFHVDYWDNLGWPDRFARPAYTERQRQYAAAWQVSSVYTPGFVLDGAEWRPRSGFPERAEASPIRLSATIKASNEVQISATGLPSHQTGTLHVAWLGFSLESKIKAGENNGLDITHQFVVLDWQHQPIPNEGANQVDFPAPQLSDPPEALAFWVTDAQGKILQVGGGWWKK